MPTTRAALTPKDDLDNFRTFYELADRLIADCSKDDVAEAARLLGLDSHKPLPN